MNRLFNILSLSCFLVAVACHKEIPDHTTPDVDVVFPYSSYIFFDAAKPTKGELVYDDLTGKDFAVTAYKYDGQWGVVSKGECKPSLFWNFQIEYNETSQVHEYDARGKSDNVLTGLATDAGGNQLPLLPWEDNMKYAFYAHYPHDENNQNPAVSPKSFDGEPYIDYTLSDDPAEMVDLMTACIKDEDNSIDNYVTLRMYHRLSAFDVFVSNEIQSIKVDGVDTEVSVQLSDIKVTFNNLMYQKASFWMDRNYKPDADGIAGIRSLTSYGTNGAAKTYIVLSDSETVKINNGDRTNLSKDGNKSLIVIPQRLDGQGKYLNGTVKFDCKFVDGEGNPVSVPLLRDDNSTIQASELNDQSMAFNVNKNVDAMNTYYLELAFINGVITLRVQSAPTWGEDVPVDYEFN